MPLVLRAYSIPPRTQLNVECITCTLPDTDSGTVAFTDLWKMVLHPDQSAIGSVLLAPRRHVSRMADLTEAEMQEFGDLLRVLEPALERTFGAELINLAYQRNWAYREATPDPPFKDGKPNPHVHWHVTPRYRHPVPFAGMTFTDPTFGEPLEWRSVHLPADVQWAVVQELQKELQPSWIAVS